MSLVGHPTSHKGRTEPDRHRQPAIGDIGTAGRCRSAPGGPRALMYAQYATDWEASARGTRYGHFKRYTLRALGAFQ